MDRYFLAAFDFFPNFPLLHPLGRKTYIKELFRASISDKGAFKFFLNKGILDYTFFLRKQTPLQKRSGKLPPKI